MTQITEMYIASLIKENLELKDKANLYKTSLSAVMDGLKTLSIAEDVSESDKSAYLKAHDMFMGLLNKYRVL